MKTKGCENSIAVRMCKSYDFTPTFAYGYVGECVGCRKRKAEGASQVGDDFL